MAIVPWRGFMQAIVGENNAQSTLIQALIQAILHSTVYDCSEAVTVSHRAARLQPRLTEVQPRAVAIMGHCLARNV
jgi:hypothetical protein